VQIPPITNAVIHSQRGLESFAFGGASATQPLVSE
jgi:hypothetical protein